MKKIYILRLIAVATLALPIYSHAADKACVSLLVGAGYAAEMQIISGNFKTDWSPSFAIGKTKCQSLDGVPIGQEYTVRVKALAGKTQSCTPSLKQTEGPGSITFQASGTTLNVKCVMPQ